MSKASEWALSRIGERPAWPNPHYWFMRVSDRGWLEVDNRLTISPGYSTDAARWMLDVFEDRG